MSARRTLTLYSFTPHDKTAFWARKIFWFGVAIAALAAALHLIGPDSEAALAWHIWLSSWLEVSMTAPQSLMALAAFGAAIAACGALVWRTNWMSKIDRGAQTMRFRGQEGVIEFAQVRQIELHPKTEMFHRKNSPSVVMPVWEVEVILSGLNGELIRTERELVARRLAEQVAKWTGRPLVDHTAAPPLRREASELDVPLLERLIKNPPAREVYETDAVRRLKPGVYHWGMRLLPCVALNLTWAFALAFAAALSYGLIFHREALHAQTWMPARSAQAGRLDWAARGVRDAVARDAELVQARTPEDVPSPRRERFHGALRFALLVALGERDEAQPARVGAAPRQARQAERRPSGRRDVDL